MVHKILCSILFLFTSAQQQNKPGRMTELGGRQLALKQFQPGIHALSSASLGTKWLTDRAVNRSLILAKETYQRTKFSFTNRKFGRIYRQGIIGRDRIGRPTDQMNRWSLIQKVDHTYLLHLKLRWNQRVIARFSTWNSLSDWLRGLIGFWLANWNPNKCSRKCSKAITKDEKLARIYVSL